MATVDTIRRVTVTDGQPDTVDNSGIVSIRSRRWRWTKECPVRPGWYAMRWIKDRRNRVVYHFTPALCQQLKDDVKWLSEVEFSDRTIQWPTESEEVDRSPFAIYEREAFEPQVEVDSFDQSIWTSPVVFCLGMFVGLVLTFLLVFILMNH